MSKKIKKLLVSILMLTMFCGFVTGCGSAKSDEQTATTTTAPEVTTNEPESTTPEETTTKETMPLENTTVKVPVSSYKFKGEKLTVEMDKKDFFTELVIENGTKLYLNDIYSGTANKDNLYRGHAGQTIAIAIWKEYNHEKVGEFEDKYWEPGTDVFKITLEQNAVIEYNEGHKWYFYYVGENEDGRAVFDIYEID